MYATRPHPHSHVQVGKGRAVGIAVQVGGIRVNVGGFVGSSVGFAVRVGASVKVGTSTFGATMTDVGVVVCVEVDSGVFVRVGSGVPVCVDSGVSVACSVSVGIATSVARDNARAVSVSLGFGWLVWVGSNPTCRSPLSTDATTTEKAEQARQRANVTTSNEVVGRLPTGKVTFCRLR